MTHMQIVKYFFKKGWILSHLHVVIIFKLNVAYLSLKYNVTVNYVQIQQNNYLHVLNRKPYDNQQWTKY